MFEMDREESDRLIEKAKLCLRSGRKEKALQLLYEAQRIYPSARARGLCRCCCLIDKSGVLWVAVLLAEIESAASGCRALYNVCSGIPLLTGIEINRF